MGRCSLLQHLLRCLRLRADSCTTERSCIVAKKSTTRYFRIFSGIGCVQPLGELLFDEHREAATNGE
jgi:hypothetical protein